MGYSESECQTDPSIDDTELECLRKKNDSTCSDTVLITTSTNNRTNKKMKKFGESFSGKRLCFLLVSVLIVITIGYGIYYVLKPTSPPDDYESKLDPKDVDSPLVPSPSVLGRYTRAAVVSNGGPCAAIGNKILGKGGSAVEAAIATALCDGVCCLQNMGIGGGFLMTIYNKKSKTATTLNARETAPSGADENMYHGNKYASQFGARAAGIPGELRGYQAAFEKYKSGNVTWSELFEPTIKLCEEGVPVNEHLANNLKWLERDIRTSSTLSEILLHENGTIPKLNDRIKLPLLAKTLRIVAESPIMADELYKGNLTKSFVNDIQMGGGIITEEDMANYKVNWSDPIVAKLSNNLTVYTMPPPGSGALLAFMLQVLDGMIPSKENNQVTDYQRITETFKHAYGRRTEFGDPAFEDMSKLLQELSSPEYVKRIKQNISDYFTSQDPRYYGAKYNLEPDHGTANIVVLAPNGDAVSVTSTVNLVFGGLFASSSTGIILNNEMDDFSAPNITNYFGVPPSTANFIKAGKRPMSSMAPTVIVDGKGDVRLVVGSAGGTKITTSIAYVTALNLWFGKNIKQAIDEPRIHHQLMPMNLAYEYGVLRHTIERLVDIGHNASRLNGGSAVTGIAKINNSITGNCDFRRGGGVDGI